MLMKLNDVNVSPYRTTVETLLNAGFKPQRTIVLAFGIDEEHGGVLVGEVPREDINDLIFFTNRVLPRLEIFCSITMA